MCLENIILHASMEVNVELCSLESTKCGIFSHFSCIGINGVADGVFVALDF